DMVHVPYKGSAPAFADLASGQVHMLFDNIPASRAMIESGKVRALAVSTRSRASAMPNVPTVDESGLPGYHVSAWQNIAMPPSTPADIVNRINREIVKFMSTPEMRKRATDMGANIALNKPEEEAERIRQEAAQWRKAVTAAGIKLEY